jgi:hypothetical protein
MSKPAKQMKVTDRMAAKDKAKCGITFEKDK